MHKLATALLFVTMLTTASHGQTVVGQPIHDFTLADLNGNFHTPNQYRGKVLGIFILGHN